MKRAIHTVCSDFSNKTIEIHFSEDFRPTAIESKVMSFESVLNLKSEPELPMGDITGEIKVRYWAERVSSHDSRFLIAYHFKEQETDGKYDRMIYGGPYLTPNY